MRELSEVKDSLDMEVKQNFIDPLQNLHDKDLREIQVSATSPLGSGQFQLYMQVPFSLRNPFSSLPCMLSALARELQKQSSQINWGKPEMQYFLLHYYDCSTHEYYIWLLHFKFSRFLKLFLSRRVISFPL